MDYIKLTEMDLQIQKQLSEKYQHQLLRLPQGKLTCKTIANQKRYYLNNEKYLGSNDARLISDLKTRAYLEKAIRVIDTNIEIQNKLLKKYIPYDYASINDMLPIAYQTDIKIAVKDPTNKFSFGTAPMHKTSFGLYTRSKSEALIAEMLYSEGIKFTYEEPLDLLDENGFYVTVHPDFTIKLKRKNDIYWEHAGLLTDLNYRDNFHKKLDLYYNNNLIIPDNLIITMDDQTGAFSTYTVKKIIEMLRN